MTCGAFVYSNFLKKQQKTMMSPDHNSSSSFALEKKKSRDDTEPIWTTTPSQNKLKEFSLLERIMLPPILKCWAL
jgi:hypothetical protein